MEIHSPENIHRVVSETHGGLFLRVKVNPRASKTAILGIENDHLKVALNVPPVEGKANQALIRLLCKKMQLPQKAFRIHSGNKRRNKVIFIANCSAADVFCLLC